MAAKRSVGLYSTFLSFTTLCTGQRNFCTARGKKISTCDRREIESLQSRWINVSIAGPKTEVQPAYLMVYVYTIGIHARSAFI